MHKLAFSIPHPLILAYTYKLESRMDFLINATFYFYLVGFITFLTLKLTRTSNTKPNLPPSPPKLPILGNIHQLGTLPHRSFRDLSLKYGPLLWLKLGRISALLVSSVDLARELVKNQDAAFAGRFQSISARTLLYECKDVAYSTCNESWKQKRKVCVLELLSLKRVRSFQAIRDEEVAEMVDEIRRAYLSDNNCSVNISDLISATTNNVIFRCIIGQKYDTAESSGRFGTLARKEMVHLAELMVGDFFPWLGWVDVLSGKIKELKDTFKAADGFFDEVTEDNKKVMKKKTKDDDEKKDFVDILLQLQETDKLEFELTKDDLKAIEMFLGGNETTTTTVEWILTELRRNPRTMRKAQEEIRKVVGSKTKVEESDLNEMNYLKLVIKEALRLHAPAPFLIPRETISDTTLGGYDIPAETMIFVNMWAIQRDPESVQFSPGSRKVARWPWQRVFSFICWLLWKNRCNKVFEGISDNPQGIVHRCLYHMSEGVQNGRFHHQIFQVAERSRGRWEPPDPGFVRVDVDGSALVGGQAACGGVIRDYQGNWMRGFQQKLGYNFPTATEIHAIRQGLQVCKQLGLKKIKLFTDSIQAMHLLSVDCGVDHPLYDVIFATKALIYRDWDLEIAHAFRESLRCADFLAREAHNNSQDYVEIGLSPWQCLDLFHQESGVYSHEPYRTPN